jgi:hypothetical protein
MISSSLIYLHQTFLGYNGVLYIFGLVAVFPSLFVTSIILNLCMLDMTKLSLLSFHVHTNTVSFLFHAILLERHFLDYLSCSTNIRFFFRDKHFVRETEL